ncbi:MAG: N-acetylneuraminate lyase [Spirochaetales bacterium]|nr:N-acetylneuraminate lyase [Spirochaetales bacterium]
MNLDKFKGIFPAQIVPFNDDNSINEKSLRKLLRRNLSRGVKGFYVCGSTGESFLMTLEERKQVLEIVKDEVGGKCTIIVQVGAISTDHAIELAKHAEKLEVDAISAVAPFYYNFTKEEIISHYFDLVHAVDLPLIIYNIPATSGVVFTTEDFKKLFREEKIIGVKHTTSDLYLLERIKNIRDDILVLFGYDEMSLSGYAMGADGAIGSTFNLMPEKYIEIKTLFEEKKLEKALEKQHIVNTIIEQLLAIGLYPAIKYALTLMGIDCGESRKPFKPLDKQARRLVEDLVKKYF